MPSSNKTALHNLCQVGNLQLTSCFSFSDTINRLDLAAHNFVPFAMCCKLPYATSIQLSTDVRCQKFVKLYPTSDKVTGNPYTSSRGHTEVDEPDTTYRYSVPYL